MAFQRLLVLIFFRQSTNCRTAIEGSTKIGPQLKGNTPQVHEKDIRIHY